jgi:hypothetical protein
VRESSELSLAGLGEAEHCEIAPLGRAVQWLMERAAGNPRLMSRIEEIGNHALERQKVQTPMEMLYLKIKRYYQDRAPWPP